MILVVGHFRVPVDHIATIRPLMRKVIAATHAEDGCLSYAYAEDVAEPGLIRVSEAWRNRECLTAHFQTPHMTRWQEERAGLGLYDREIKIWEVGEGEQV